jgi:hypothetical protein
MKPFKVIGIGLNKTGTKTLAACLKQLGYENHVSVRRRDLLLQYKNGQIEDIFKIMDEYESFEDWPFPLMYKELYFRYGDSARFILTKRKDANAWLASLKRHSLRTDPDRHCRLLAYGYNYPHGFEKEHVAFYNRHNDEVVEFFDRQAASHLLQEVSWDAGDRWDGICSFLGEPVPAADFPHENRGEAPIAEEIMQENRVRIEHQLKELPGAASSIGV